MRSEKLKVASIRVFDKNLEEMKDNLNFLATVSNIYSIDLSEFSSSVDPLEIASDLSIALATLGVTIFNARSGLAVGVGGIFLDETIGSDGAHFFDWAAVYQ